MGPKDPSPAEQADLSSARLGRNLRTRSGRSPKEWSSPTDVPAGRPRSSSPAPTPVGGDRGCRDRCAAPVRRRWPIGVGRRRGSLRRRSLSVGDCDGRARLVADRIGQGSRRSDDARREARAGEPRRGGRLREPQYRGAAPVHPGAHPPGQPERDRVRSDAGDPTAGLARCRRQLRSPPCLSIRSGRGPGGARQGHRRRPRTRAESGPGAGERAGVRSLRGRPRSYRCPRCGEHRGDPVRGGDGGRQALHGLQPGDGAPARQRGRLASAPSRSSTSHRSKPPCSRRTSRR